MTNDNSKGDMESSHEKSPSELRTPKTISEDSFILDRKEKNDNENIKVNIKSDDIFKLLNLDKKNKIKKNSKQNMLYNNQNNKSSKNINNKLRLNKQNFFGFILSAQKSIIVKKIIFLIQVIKIKRIKAEVNSMKKLNKFIN